MNTFVSFNKYKNFLFETYESQQELTRVANDIMSIKDNIKHYAFYHISELIDPDDYKIVGDFLRNAKLSLIIAPDTQHLFGDEKVNGIYIGKKEFDNLKMKKSVKDKIKQSFNAILFILKPDVITILHELQHAYDDYRSNGKYISDKKRHLLIKAFKRGDEGSYFRTDHELSAYFTGIISSLEFINEYDQLRDFRSIYEELKEEWPGYEILTPRIKKIILRKLSSYYEKLKEERMKV